MCRLLSLISNTPQFFGPLLHDAPRSLAELSTEHRDGWGMAAYDEKKEWKVHRGVLCAKEDPRFYSLAGETLGTTLIAHVRQKTVGPIHIENTHPFMRNGWVFAHNGTIKKIDELKKRTSLKQVESAVGDTDSEKLFGTVLSYFEKNHLLSENACGLSTEIRDRVLSGLCVELRNVSNFGSFNFLLSNGQTTYAHRYGRSLFLLTRKSQTDSPLACARGEFNNGLKSTLVDKTQEAPRANCNQLSAIVVASERITNEAWEEIPDSTLLRISYGADGPKYFPIKT